MGIFSVKGAPFRYKGAVNVEDCTTSEEVLNKAGLNWSVAKCELVAKMPLLGIDNDFDEDSKGFAHAGSYYKPCEGAFATYRTDCNIPLGLVKQKYTPVQNINAFTFFDDNIGKDKAIWQTAGWFGNGERIFVSAKLPNDFTVKGDPVENYLVFTNSHDGSSGVKILFTPIRVVCQNTLNAAIKTSTNYVSFRHTQSVGDRINQAAEILGICKKQTEFLSEQFNIMRSTMCTDDQARELFAKVILSENEFNTIKETGHTLLQVVNKEYTALEDANISMKKANVLQDMHNYYFLGAGQREIVGNMWGAYNAVTGYYSNVDNSEGTKRMDSILYGDKSNKIKLASDLILSQAI